MIKKIAFLTLLLTLTHHIFAQTLSDADIVQAKLNAIRTMSAHFKQVVTAGKRNVSSTVGTMALSRPGRFRWQTKDPLAQLIVADSKQLWIYDIDLEQVTVKKQEKGIGGTPALFLSGYNNTVARDFVVTKTENQSFDLKTKSHKENYQRIKLTFNGDSLEKIEFFDQLGQHTVVELSQVKSNIKLANALFHFTPPKGVDIVRQ